MTPSHRSASQLWAIARHRLFTRRGSYGGHEYHHPAFDSTLSSPISEHTDGFYMYSQEILEKNGPEYRSLAEDMGIRTSDSTGASYKSAPMVPIGRPSIPYTIGAPDWNIFTTAVQDLDHPGDANVTDWRNSVLSVYVRVYTVAKVMVMVFLHYGVEIDDIPDGILAYIRRAEQLVISDKVTHLVENVEDLFHALYARLIMELANVELCACFPFGVARVSSYNNFILPEPRHLFRILLMCKEILDTHSICTTMNKELIRHYQTGFIRRSVERLMSTGFDIDDLIGFRRHALAIARDQDSPFRQKWDGPGLIYQMPPPEVLAIQSEKYMAFAPREAIDDIVPNQNLPFVEWHMVDPKVWASEIILDHREAARALLEGITLGQLRQTDDDRRQVIDYMRERKCTCWSTCSCGMICTREPDRPCPCAGWRLTMHLARCRTDIGPFSFRDRCSILSRAVFQWVASLRDDADFFEPEAAVVQLAGQPGSPPRKIFWRWPKSTKSSLRQSCQGLPVGKLLAGMVPKTLASSTAGPVIRRSPLWSAHSGAPRTSVRRYRAVWPSYGITTPVPDPRPQVPLSRSPYCFQTGYALCAKRPSRPFPPPFLSPPSSSFSDPLTTHYLSQDKRLSVRGDLVRGLNNGDDAILVAENYLAVNDGVGAWATRPRGHAALWSRLLLHFWALEIEREARGQTALDPIGYLQRAYEETTQATTSPGEWFGTTTSASALLHWKRDDAGNVRPLLYVTNLGDCKIFVIRPREKKILFQTQEQWHWFDCPIQLGTNSVDTPRKDAVLSVIDVQEGDLVLAVSDGVLDNLWEHEILTAVLDSMDKWAQGRYDEKGLEWAPPAVLAEEQMVFIARELLKAALTIAQDPFAESPYMEKAVDEGLAIQGGKMDDISVVIGSCKKRTDEAVQRPSGDSVSKMRAKRSKKYRKLMHQYELTFGFREAYQVLVDSNFLRAVHSFKMELIPALERTVQGKVKPLLTKCSLAAIMASQPINPRTNNPYRPEHLPPPTVLPLRHCSHNADSTPIDEVACLLSLLSPSTETKKNKEHYILATADPAAPAKDKNASEAGRKRKRNEAEEKAEAALRKARELRREARSIPGVPIVYVKRSVMVLEPMSNPSDAIREGVEKGKFRAGLNDETKKKEGGDGAGAAEKKKKRDLKKPKAPNPLSMRKPKKREQEVAERPKRKSENEGEREGERPERDGEDGGDAEAAPKPKRRRRHHNRGAKTEGEGEGEGKADGGDAPADAMDD
ncbi:hypothetical protein BO70DRAFT_386147 [Aspergillus heteromorphus CBS 117.55]|uniref:PPM-type phosphatase domain-containing protein n=1 Tax=Aspergillus heteromorphus CBS 117.55 TaxID=1448321 RepID=A0A317WKH0_9EURO|nr:uncharacterized protein BO70DRAFT_386147 [Aspergillus heteromorphus CBS 117.55]PWY86863.1 hypothetical protein BO70DRAFT_386147 [Aspergillus heteromorphus CBS 117.55]